MSEWENEWMRKMRELSLWWMSAWNQAIIEIPLNLPLTIHSFVHSFRGMTLQISMVCRGRFHKWQHIYIYIHTYQKFSAYQGSTICTIHFGQPSNFVKCCLVLIFWHSFSLFHFVSFALFPCDTISFYDQFNRPFRAESVRINARFRPIQPFYLLAHKKEHYYLINSCEIICVSVYIFPYIWHLCARVWVCVCACCLYDDPQINIELMHHYLTNWFSHKHPSNEQKIK